ncbi:MAG TPA: protein-methionine-sulfoxide reductase catalytic subunit MsrP [Vicinamibacterales bacterium]|jgi:methionine sulfoxide reductase catalytic subunit|nr:protein-methionine-sulfoxide reductase catalytic subunit MsrP [Vicinamibacterales bacterium]
MAEIRSSEITDQRVYLNRRAFIAAAMAVGGAALVVDPRLSAQTPAAHGAKLTTVKSPLSTTESPNVWEHLTTYNNFYEFGTRKSDPAANARSFKPRQPWTISVEGECAKRGTITLEDVLKGQTLEDRIYRMRCVEGWSMVIPWVGFPLATLIKRCQPTSKAAFVEFTTLLDPRQMPGQESDVLEWPYVEGLRMDEALHPLTILAVGIYGEVLPNQNGAPLRLVVPWKYGFKGIKSIVKIRFVEKQPFSSWQQAWPEAYGFYANVNPAVEHPKWSQATEARLPSLFKTMRTMPFNGYGDQVASLYTRMDLTKSY